MDNFWAGVSFKTVLGSPHKDEKFLFSVLASITNFVFDKILGSFWAFVSPNEL